MVFASSHESFLDPLLVGAWIPRGMWYLARRSLFFTKDARRSAWRTWLGRVCGVIELDVGAGGREALRRALEALRRGDTVLVFPEGTRSPDGSVRDFEPGVGLLALRSGARVVPVSVEGSHLVWPRDRKLPRLRGGPVRVRFGEATVYRRPTKAEDAAADMRRRVLDLRAGRQQAPARDGADAHGIAGGGPSR